jgi:hypothetical protein
MALNHRLRPGWAWIRAALADGAARWFSGAEVPPGADPVALAYAGHQFGGFSPSLGDGRAHLLGEIVDGQGRRWDLQLKGSGRTPFSRGGDGKAALGPMLREYLVSEAMAALGVPTTRALAVVTTGEDHLARCGPPAGRRSGAGGGQPYPRRQLPVLCRAGRGGQAARRCRLHAWPGTIPHLGAITWACSRR